MIFLFIIIFIIILIIEIPRLVKDQDWLGLKVYSFFMLIAFILTLLQLTGVKIPSPMKAMVFLIRDLLHLNYG